MATSQEADLKRSRRAPARAAMAGLRMAAAVVCVWTAVACGEIAVLSGATLEPAIVPLRAIPQVFIVRGELAAEKELAKSLAKHLAALGYTRAEVVDQEGLRSRLLGSGVGRAMAIVELAVQRREDYHYGYAAPRRTLCDSLGCFSVPGGGQLGLPSLEATVVLNVRVGRSMTSQQTATLRTVVFAEDIATLRTIATAKLESRLQQLVDVQRNWLAADFYDEHEASEGLDLAEDGKWVEAAASQHRAAEQPGLSPNIVARLLYNAGLCQAFVDEGANLQALESGLLWMEQAQRLVPRDSRIEHGLRFLRTRQRSARLLHAQRAAAHHNFTIAGMAQSSKP